MRNASRPRSSIPSLATRRRISAVSNCRRVSWRSVFRANWRGTSRLWFVKTKRKAGDQRLKRRIVGRALRAEKSEGATVFVVISYDIADDKRRGRIFKALKNFGQWMQYSVFE